MIPSAKGIVSYQSRSAVIPAPPARRSPPALAMEHGRRRGGRRAAPRRRHLPMTAMADASLLAPCPALPPYRPWLPAGRPSMWACAPLKLTAGWSSPRIMGRSWRPSGTGCTPIPCAIAAPGPRRPRLGPRWSAWPWRSLARVTGLSIGKAPQSCGIWPAEPVSRLHPGPTCCVRWAGSWRKISSSSTAAGRSPACRGLQCLLKLWSDRGVGRARHGFCPCAGARAERRPGPAD